MAARRPSNSEQKHAANAATGINAASEQGGSEACQQQPQQEQQQQHQQRQQSLSGKEKLV